YAGLGDRDGSRARDRSATDFSSPGQRPRRSPRAASRENSDKAEAVKETGAGGGFFRLRPRSRRRSLTAEVFEKILHLREKPRGLRMSLLRGFSLKFGE